RDAAGHADRAPSVPPRRCDRTHQTRRILHGNDPGRRDPWPKDRYRPSAILLLERHTYFVHTSNSSRFHASLLSRVFDQPIHVAPVAGLVAGRRLLTG